MRNIKIGFTLAEILITISIVGIVAAICLPAFRHILPNKNTALFKKAYYTTSRIVSELVNDDDLYPDVTEGNQYLGNTESVTYRGDTYSGTTKFCELFAAKINKSSEEDCSEMSFTNGSASDGQFTTTDATVWILPITTFASDIESYNIYVDTNGSNSPNCFYNANTCTNPDRFQIDVYQDGRVAVSGVYEKDCLSGEGTLCTK